MKALTKSLFAGTAIAVCMTSIGIDGAYAAIDELVVFTRKRDENLQDLPLSVSVFTSENIEKLGIDDIQDVAKYTASIIFDEGFGPSDQRFVIRGLSPTRGRPNSAVLVDGIDFTTEAVSTAGGSIMFDQRLLDVENIEIVKGPQSALYGRAAFAGAVQYVTKGPSDEFEGRVAVDIGDEGRYSVNGGVSGPVSDTLGLRVNGLYWTDDGFYNDTVTGSDLGGGEGIGISAAAHWEASEDITIRARLSYADDEFDPQATIFDRANTVLIPPASALALPNITPLTTASLFTGQAGNLGSRRPALTPNPRTGTGYPGAERQVFSASLIAEWDIGFGTLSSLTGYTDGDTAQAIDGDQDVVLDASGTMDIARGGAELIFDTDTEIFSQELRFASQLEGPVQFTVGGLYWTEEVNQIETSVVTLGFGQAPGFNNAIVPVTVINPALVGRETDHWSIYGLVEWEINDQWRASFEARYGHEELDVQAPSCGYTGATAVFCAFAAPSIALDVPPSDGIYEQPPTIQVMDDTSDNYIAPKVTLEWSPRDNALIYASVAQGIKPAGITTIGGGGFLDANRDLTFEEAKFDQEKLLTYELGAKTQWLDGTLQVNGAVFFQDYEDRQVPVRRNVGIYPVPFVENAGGAEVFGIELDTLWAPTDNLSLQLSYAYLDGEYDEFTYLTDSVSNIARAGNCTLTTTPDGTFCLVDLSGKTMEDIPDHAVTASVTYRDQFPNMDLGWFVEGNVQYQDDRFADEFNDRGVDSFSVVDLRFGLEAEQWDVIFYVNNVFDDDTIQNWTSGGGGIVETAESLSFFPSSGFGFAPDPRHIGIRASYEF